ncbi:hypothetical protein [Escherichia albertii]|nr:hypothetical protein [Escherichia albertii]
MSDFQAVASKEKMSGCWQCANTDAGGGVNTFSGLQANDAKTK